MNNNKSKIPRLGGGTTGLWFEHPWHLPSGNQAKQWNIVHLQWSFPALKPHYFNYFPANHGRLPTIIAFHGCKTHNTGKAGDGLPTLPIHWTCLSLKEKSPAPSFPINQLFSKKNNIHWKFPSVLSKKSSFHGTNTLLVGGIPTPSSVGMMLPNTWKVIKVMFQTTNQLTMKWD